MKWNRLRWSMRTLLLLRHRRWRGIPISNQSHAFPWTVILRRVTFYIHVGLNKDTTQPLMSVNHEEANLFGFNSFRYIKNLPLIIAEASTTIEIPSLRTSSRRPREQRSGPRRSKNRKRAWVIYYLASSSARGPIAKPSSALTFLLEKRYGPILTLASIDRGVKILDKSKIIEGAEV